jgi:hypothetical protein
LSTTGEPSEPTSPGLCFSLIIKRGQDGSESETIMENPSCFRGR